MTTLPTPTIRLKLDPLNPGHFVACCGVLELADRAWGGAEGWFEERDAFFCAAPCELDTSRDFGGAALLESIRSAMLTNVLMNGDQRKRLDELSTTLKKSKMNAGAADHGGTEPSFAALKAEKDALEALWDEAKDGALFLGPPFNVRLDWFLDRQTGAGRFKTWAGQQNITDLALELKRAVSLSSFENGSDWLFARMACHSSLHFDAMSAATDLDIGFSFDPLKIRTTDKRALVELLALVGLQRFSPRRIADEDAYAYATWVEPLLPQVALAAAHGYGAASLQMYEFRLLFRSKYLKSFLPAKPWRSER